MIFTSEIAILITDYTYDIREGLRCAKSGAEMRGNMIENLKGIHETVNYKSDSNLRLYRNTETEDYPQHWHTPVEIIMPVRNQYSVLLGEHCFSLNAGDIIFICPGVIHALKAPSEGERIIFQAEISPLNALKKFESILGLFSSAIIISPAEAPAIHTRIQELLLEICTEYNENTPLSEVSIYAKLLEMFVLIGRNHAENTDHFDVGNQKQKEYTEKFISICNYIQEHCTEELSLDEIAEIAGFSKFHFSRLFKQFTNATFYKYLNQKRIAHAELLLANPEISVTQVALHSGFSSLSAFIRMFKLVKNCTPTEFRNMYTH